MRHPGHFWLLDLLPESGRMLSFDDSKCYSPTEWLGLYMFASTDSRISPQRCRPSIAIYTGNNCGGTALQTLVPTTSCEKEGTVYTSTTCTSAALLARPSLLLVLAAALSAWLLAPRRY
eukprot:tig00020904_g15277.t1